MSNLTLIKNLDGFLPMEGGEKNSVFGKNGTSLVYGGGSGSGHVNGETQIDLQKSLTDAGFEINGGDHTWNNSHAVYAAEQSLVTATMLAH